MLNKQAQRQAVLKLATQQDTMLTTLERLSWLVLLLATATFMAFMQPPGAFDDNRQVLMGNYTSCSTTDFLPDLQVYQECALFLFFVFDALSFSFSLGCVVMIVILSMPRIRYRDHEEEAGRFWWLLLVTWLLLYLAVVSGTTAFALSAISMFSKLRAVGPPLAPGAVLLVLGMVLMLRRFKAMYPGWRALMKGLPCFGEGLPQCVEDDEEIGLVMSNRFWGRAEEVIARAGRSSAVAATPPLAHVAADARAEGVTAQAAAGGVEGAGQSVFDPDAVTTLPSVCGTPLASDDPDALPTSPSVGGTPHSGGAKQASASYPLDDVGGTG